MSRIKSALEIALERTESVKGDRSSLEQFEAKQEGKRLAGAYLEDPERDLSSDLKKQPKETRDAVRKGVCEVLLSQVNLPYIKDDLPRLERIGAGLHAVLADKRLLTLFQQLGKALDQYLSEADQYEQAIRQQYAPKLRQKEEEIAKRTGRRMRLDPMQDPEFVAFYNQNMGALKDRYQGAIDEVRDQVRLAAGLD